MLHQPAMTDLKGALDDMLRSINRSLDNVDFVLTGISADRKSDKAYFDETKNLFGNKPLLKYKHLFGENFTASGLGFYVAAQCLKEGKIPAHLFVDITEATDKRPSCILIFNHSDGKDYTLTLMEA